MSVLVSILIVALVGAVIMYPFLGRRLGGAEFEEEGSVQSERDYRWESVVTGLQNAEMERAIGSLPKEEYQSVRRRYMAEGAALLRAADLEYQNEEGLPDNIQAESQISGRSPNNGGNGISSSNESGEGSVG